MSSTWIFTYCMTLELHSSLACVMRHKKKKNDFLLSFWTLPVVLHWVTSDSR